MGKRKFVFLLLTVLCAGIANSIKLPDSIQVCSRSDPNLEQCLIKATEMVLKTFKDGNSDFHFPHLVPLKLNKLVVGEGKGAVNVVQNYENVRFVGLLPTNITKHSFKIDGNKVVINLESINSKVEFLANYNISGKVMLLPVQGQGECHLSFDNLKIIHALEGKIIEKDGKKYVEIEKYNVESEPAHATYAFDNLFNGDPVLGPQINQLLNDNWKEIYDDVGKGYEEALGIIFKEFANKIFRVIPLNELLLE